MFRPDSSDITALYGLVEKSSAISIIVHSHPDGDAVGSGVGMLTWLSSLGKDAALVLPEACPPAVSFLVEGLTGGGNKPCGTASGIGGKVLVHEDDPEAAESRLLGSDLIICQDFNTFSRTAALEEALTASTCPKVLIDHHLSPDREKFVLCMSKTDISSTAELLYSILIAMPGIDGDAKRLPPLCATALMTGMTTDTNNFANSVYPSTLTMASDLLDAGVDRDFILDNVYHKFGESRVRLMGYLLDRRLKITPEGVAYMIMTRRTAMRFGVQEGDTEGFVNIPLSIEGVRMSIFLKEDKDRFRVSIRSKKGTSANSCAKEYFNGGGHELASGGKLMKDGRFKNARDVEKWTVTAIRSFFGTEKTGNGK